MKKKIWRRFLALGLSVGIISSAVVLPTAVYGNSEGTEEEVTLSMWVWDDFQVPATQAMIDEFEEENPNIKVEVTSVANVNDYNTKMQTVLGSGDAPEVFWLNFVLSKDYIATGLIQDLTDWIEADESFDLNALNEGITSVYTRDGRVYGIAKDTDAYAVYYNKALFDAAGVAYPTDDWTTDDFAEAAKQLTTDTVKGFGNSGTDRVYFNFMYSFGGSPYTEDGLAPNVNSEGSVAGVQFLMDLMNNGYAYTGPEVTEVNEGVAFQSNMCAMIIDGSWMVSEYLAALGDNLGIVELPEGPAGRASCGQGLAYATSTSNEHMEETWKFLSYLGSDRAQEKQVEVVIPAAKACASKWEETYPDLNLHAFTEALAYNKPYMPNINAVKTRSTFMEYQANLMAGMYENAQEAMDAAQAAMEASMAE